MKCRARLHVALQAARGRHREARAVGFDWVSRSTGRKEGAAAPRPEQGAVFAVKLQVPMAQPGMPVGVADDAAIAIYSQDRSVMLFLPKAAPGMAYKLLDAAVRKSVAGNAGLKLYVNAKIEARGDGGHEALVIDVGRPLPAQPW